MKYVRVTRNITAVVRNPYKSVYLIHYRPTDFLLTTEASRQHDANACVRRLHD